MKPNLQRVADASSPWRPGETRSALLEAVQHLLVNRRITDKLYPTAARECACGNTTSCIATCTTPPFRSGVTPINMTASAKGTVKGPGKKLKQKAGLNRAIRARPRGHANVVCTKQKKLGWDERCRVLAEST
jgi:hypothetical protein